MKYRNNDTRKLMRLMKISHSLPSKLRCVGCILYFREDFCSCMIWIIKWVDKLLWSCLLNEISRWLLTFNLQKCSIWSIEHNSVLVIFRPQLALLIIFGTVPRNCTQTLWHKFSYTTSQVCLCAVLREVWWDWAEVFKVKIVSWLYDKVISVRNCPLQTNKPK